MNTSTTVDILHREFAEILAFLDGNQAFMEIGRDRNRLVHQNFGSFSLEKTSSEIYDAFRLATKFVDWFPDALREYSSMRADTC